jgi:hypothetical protein
MKAILRECGGVLFSKTYYKFYGVNNIGDLEFDLHIRSNNMLDIAKCDEDYDIEIIIKKKPKPVDETIVTIK